MPIDTAAAFFRSKCPVCSQGELFAGYLKIADRCNICNADFSQHDCGDGPIFFVMTILCFTIVPLAVAIEFIFSPSILVHIILWPVICLVFSLFLLRKLRGLFTALKFKVE